MRGKRNRKRIAAGLLCLLLVLGPLAGPVRADTEPDAPADGETEQTTSAEAEESPAPEGEPEPETTAEAGSDAAMETEQTEAAEAPATEAAPAEADGEEPVAPVRVTVETTPAEAEVTVFFWQPEEDPQVPNPVQPEPDGSWLLLPGDYKGFALFFFPLFTGDAFLFRFLFKTLLLILF